MVDAESLTSLGIYPFPMTAPLWVPLCGPDDSVLYVTYFVERFNRNSMTWMSRVEGSFGSRGIAQSRLIPRRPYVGEAGGYISTVDRVLNQRVDGLPIPGGDDEWAQVYELVLSNRDALLYFSRTGDGVVIADTAGVIRATIPLWGPPLALQLSSDGLSLYAPDQQGLWEIAADGGWYRRQVTPAYEPLYFDLSPSGERVFITTRDDENDPLTVDLGHELLIDVNTWQVLATVAHERLGWHGGVAFHPNGKLMFAARNFDIDVFLNRER